MQEVVIASRNSGKLREIELCLKDMPFLLLRNMGQFPGLGQIKEDGKTFEENALIKARSVAAALGRCTLADDSGLEVLALDGCPGVHSARFAGPNATDDDNNQLLVEKLAGLPREKRRARFVCVIAVVTQDGRELLIKGQCDGEILTQLRGHGGFGYDPLFFVPSIGKTFAELIPAEKARISHRGQSLEELHQKLPDFLGL
jgi:XTP/dITP diphosphohydrolase